MKIHVTKPITKPTEFLEDCLCNRCGKSMLSGSIPAFNEHDASCEGLVDGRVRGSFGSEHLHDMTEYRFSLCEACLVDLFNSFEIPVEIRDLIDGEPTTWEDDRAAKRKQDERVTREA